jgi:hypothetical protein
MEDTQTSDPIMGEMPEVKCGLYLQIGHGPEPILGYSPQHQLFYTFSGVFS